MSKENPLTRVKRNLRVRNLMVQYEKLLPEGTSEVTIGNATIKRRGNSSSGNVPNLYKSIWVKHPYKEPFQEHEVTLTVQEYRTRRGGFNLKTFVTADTSIRTRYSPHGRDNASGETVDFSNNRIAFIEARTLLKQLKEEKRKSSHK